MAASAPRAPSCRQRCSASVDNEARPSTSLVDDTIDVPARIFLSEVWDTVPEGSSVISQDIRISL